MKFLELFGLSYVLTVICFVCTCMISCTYMFPVDKSHFFKQVRKNLTNPVRFFQSLLPVCWT